MGIIFNMIIRNHILFLWLGPVPNRILTSISKQQKSRNPRAEGCGFFYFSVSLVLLVVHQRSDIA